MKKRNRYIIIGLSMVFLIFFLMIVLFLFEKNRELEEANSTIKMEKQILSDNISSFEYLNSLTIDSFEKKVAEGDDLFVYIGNSECSDCSIFSKTLKKEVETFPLKNSLYLVEISSIHSDNKRWLDFKKKYNFEQTPAFLLFKNGEIKSMIEWTEQEGLSSEAFHNWLKSNESVIKELGS